VEEENLSILGDPTQIILHYITHHGSVEALRSMGLAKLSKIGWERRNGAEEVIRKANSILGFV
jgi:hypothetical protein